MRRILRRLLDRFHFFLALCVIVRTHYDRLPEQNVSCRRQFGLQTLISAGVEMLSVLYCIPSL